MPRKENIIDIPWFKIVRVEKSNVITFKVKYEGEVCCPRCGGNILRAKAKGKRRVRHESIGNKKVFLEFTYRKYLCCTCDRYFNQRFPGILPYRRSTEKFRNEVFQKHQDGICQSTLSKRLGIGTATVERWSNDYLKRIVSEKNNYSCPKVIGIDEHHFSKKDGYATTICDLVNHRVYDLTLGRSEKSLEAYFSSLKGKENVKVVVMDLAETYRNIIKKHFPNSKIVADRFHVIRLVNHHFMKQWQVIDPIGRKNRGLLSLMRRHESKLTDIQKDNLYRYFEVNSAIKPIYEFKQKLCRLLLLKSRTKKQVKRLIRIFLRYLELLEDSMLPSMMTLGRTIKAWSEEIVRMWRFRKSNGITEGFHNKMELIARRAYGFRNFENYRLRVKALCA